MGSEQSKVKADVRVDFEKLSEETKLSQDELRAWYKRFCKDCPDGVLTMDKFTRLYHQFYPTKEIPLLIEHLFRTVDVNGDGSVDFEELMRSLSTLAKGSPQDKLSWLFRMFDENDDGCVSREDIMRIIKAVMPAKKRGQAGEAETVTHMTDMMFTLLDTDNNGEISHDEFITGSKHVNTMVQMINFLR